MLGVLATFDLLLLLAAFGTLCGIVAIVTLLIRRRRRERYGRKKVQVWAPF